MQVQGRMKTSTHLLVGHAFDQAVNREAGNHDRQLKPQTFKNAVRLTLANLMQALLRDPNQPRVRQKVDRFGNAHWTVYDPQVQRSLSFDQETEVRQWLEQRYYGAIVGKVA